ncbi:RusA family crossover junction endodeoxyribonuclease [bacterium]|nr:RusA family crossover junction endodeoxyribonuclease [bacterium]
MIKKRNRLNIKPLSVNKAWQGKRFKTKDYKVYEQELLLILPKYNIPKGNLEIIYEVGYSNKLSDIDNFVKPFQDILQKKYNFDDNRIYKMIVEKKIVKKGEEYIKFEINEQR